jgi:hypothetical protein
MKFRSAIVTPVIDMSMRSLCIYPYYKHPKGCPNYGKKEICPPKIGYFQDVFDDKYDIWALWAEFDLATHVKQMRMKHPTWSYRQLSCCLYWQGTVRAFLKQKADEWVEQHAAKHPKVRDIQGFTYTTCPEGMGVNVTATMRNIGVVLEWPPKKIVRKIYLVGVLRQ